MSHAPGGGGGILLKNPPPRGGMLLKNSAFRGPYQLKTVTGGARTGGTADGGAGTRSPLAHARRACPLFFAAARAGLAHLGDEPLDPLPRTATAPRILQPRRLADTAFLCSLIHTPQMLDKAISVPSTGGGGGSMPRFATREEYFQWKTATQSAAGLPSTNPAPPPPPPPPGESKNESGTTESRPTSS